MEWTANHELGHTVGMGHATSNGDTSTMVSGCASTWSTVQSQEDSVGCTISIGE